MSNLNIKQHVLSPEIWRGLSPNNSGFFQDPPKYIVMHYTGGASAMSAKDWLSNPKARGKPSAHVVVGFSEIDTYQIVPFNKIAHHAGRSYYKGFSYLNKHSIGIEVVNAGLLTKDQGHWRTWYGANVFDEEVYIGSHKKEDIVRGWKKYPVEQVQLVERIVELILDAYPSIKEVIGHDDISWPRKTDPGPAFPMWRLKNLTDRRDLSGSRLQEPQDELEVTASVLNIRGGPGTEFERIKAYGPLKRGQHVRKLDDEDNGWVFVELMSGEHQGNRGYVFDKFLKEKKAS